MHLYRAHGLLFACEFDLPDLDPATQDDARRTPDVHIRRAALPHLRARPPFLDLLIEEDERRVSFVAPDTAAFEIRDGREIAVDPLTDAPDYSAITLRAFLLGRALGALLFQRGLVPLHGSAVAIGGAAAIMVGPRGAGKSTFCYHAMRAGHTLLADDVVCLTRTGAGFGLSTGIRRNKLWDDTLAHYGVSTEGLDPVEGRSAKYHVFHDDLVPVRSLSPLGGIFVLSDFESRAAPAVTRLDPVAATMRVYQEFYLVEALKPMGLMAGALAHAAAIGRAVPVFSLQRSRDLSDMDRVLDTVAAALRDPGPVSVARTG